MRFLIITAALVLAAPAVAHEKPTTAPVAAPAQPKPKPTHSGGTDQYGCHTNHQTGDYHCHNPK